MTPPVRYLDRRTSLVVLGCSFLFFLFGLGCLVMSGGGGDDCGDVGFGDLAKSLEKKEKMESEEWWKIQRAAAVAAVDRELARSLDNYVIPEDMREKAWEFLAFMLSMPDYFVFVVNQKVFVSRRFLHHIKHIKHVSYVRTALDRLPSKNVVYQFEGGASGTSNRFECGRPVEEEDTSNNSGRMTKYKHDAGFHSAFRMPVPRMCIAKREGYDKCGVMIPNPYIGNLTEWEEKSTKIRNKGRKRAFVRRDGRIFWRGSIGGYNHAGKEGCSRELGNFARFAATTLTHVHPTRVDVRCLECNPRDDTMSPCPDFPYDSEMKEAFRNLERVKGEFVADTQFSRYKHVLNLPGSTTGSYSRNLNHLWMLGSIVFLWKSAHVEWYYPALLEGFTHLAVNKSTVLSALDAVESSPALTNRLLAGARLVDEALICADCLATYLIDVFVAYRRKFKIGPILEKNNLFTFLQSFNCSHLDIVEFVFVEPQNKTSYVREIGRDGQGCLSLYEAAYDPKKGNGPLSPVVINSQS